MPGRVTALVFFFFGRIMVRPKKGNVYCENLLGGYLNRILIFSFLLMSIMFNYGQLGNAIKTGSDTILPRELGNLGGTISDSETASPIVEAEVTVDGMTVITDAAGYYLFSDLETGFYDIDVMAAGYNSDGLTGIEVLEDQTATADFALDPFTGVVFELSVDGYPAEATWNVWDITNQILVWDTDHVFTTAGETIIIEEELPDGNYEVWCHDTYGDGGISGIVSKEDAVLTEWVSGDYTLEGVFPFAVSPILFGGLQGIVTDAYTANPISGATVVCGNYYGMTDDMGNYSISDVLIGDYDVSCDAPGFTGQVLPVTIMEDEVTTQDFVLDLIKEAPQNLMADVDGYDINLQWTQPYEAPTDILHWDDMTNGNSVGLNTGGTFIAAARFTPSELSPYDGMIMNSVTVYINDMPSDMILYVWSGANAANVLVQQTVTPAAMDWNNIILNTPVVIDASDELWIGYETTSFTGEHPAGTDLGPAEAGYGDMISFDGVSWGALSIISTLNYNWNIWGGISGSRGEYLVLARPQPWHREPIQVDHRIEFSTGGVVTHSEREFTGTYNVHRNDMLLDTATETMYGDLGLNAGNYEYYVTAVYDEGESASSNVVTVELGSAVIAVDPEEFEVVLPDDGMAEYTFNIGNPGNLDLEYDATIMYLEGRAVLEAYPQSADYWTGSTDGSSFTSTSMINGYNTEDGWAMFDVSGIPDGAIINNINCSVYVNSTIYPWWSITPCTEDPLATDAATLSTHITAGGFNGVAYSYNNEANTFITGWHTYPLGGTAIADLQASLGQDWFACGISSRDNSISGYIYIDGWNEDNPPYLTIDYSVPINPWVTFDGEMTISGMIPAGGEADEIMVNFDAAGLFDGDVMMGQIVLNSNDHNNLEYIVPVTLTVGDGYLYGDVTGDEVVDAYDAANILQFAVVMEPVAVPLPWTWQLIAGDVDGNGTPESYDAALVLQYSVGIIDVFPVESRMESPVADVSMTIGNGEFIFSTTGDLYGFSVMTETALIDFQESVVAYLHAVNGNAIALASVEEISGEFLRIPFEKIAESGEFTMTMTVNGVSNENTYNIEDLENVVAANAVLGNYPNPFNPSTTIALAVKDDNTPVKVSIYNVKGQLVNILVDETVASGLYNFDWSGKDSSNRPVSSGVYFYKVKIGNLNATHKMLMLK